MNISLASLGAVSIEQVSKVVQTVYAGAVTTIADNFISSTPEQVKPNQKAVKFVLETLPAMSVGVVNEDGGALPKASAPAYTSFYVGTYPLYAAASVTQREKDLTQSDGVLIDIVQKTIGNLATAMAEMDALHYHLDDNGIYAGGIGTGASAVTVSGTQATYTFNAAGDIIGTNRLLVGQVVEVFVQALSARRVPPDTAKPTVVIAVDKAAKTVVLENAPAAGAVGDRLLVPGMIAPDPANGFHSGFATGTLTTTPAAAASPNPLTVSGPASAFLGSPFRKGLPYMCDSDPAHYYFTNLRSAIPHFKPVGYDGGTSILTPVILMAWRLAFEEKLNKPIESVGMIRAITHPKTTVDIATAQYTANAATAWTNAQILIPSAATDAGPVKDPVLKKSGMGGRPTYMEIEFHHSPMWRRGHVGLFCNPQQTIKKVVAQNGEPAILDLAGRSMFEGRDAYGKVRLTEEQYMRSNFDLACSNPGLNGEIYNLATA